MRLDTYYLNIAEAASKRSKCVSLKVGCVLVMNDKIVSTGLNGTVRGDVNCCDHFKGNWHEDHHTWSLEHEIHAEMNALIQAGRDLMGAWAFTTTSPCNNCLKHMRAAGITRIYYRHGYKHTTAKELTLLKVYKGIHIFKEGEDDNFNN